MKQGEYRVHSRVFQIVIVLSGFLLIFSVWAQDIGQHAKDLVGVCRTVRQPGETGLEMSDNKTVIAQVVAYDPTEDPNLGSKGDKGADLNQVDQLGDRFQKDQRIKRSPKEKPPGTGQPQSSTGNNPRPKDQPGTHSPSAPPSSPSGGELGLGKSAPGGAKNLPPPKGKEQDLDSHGGL